MNVVTELVNEIMYKNQLLNPNQVANRLNMDRSHLGKLLEGKANPNALNYLKMAKEAGWDLNKALEKIEGNKEKGNIDMSLLKVTALFSMLALGPFSSGFNCILCKIKGILIKTEFAKITFNTFKFR